MNYNARKIFHLLSRKETNIYILLAILIVLPYFVVSIYANPTGDDYWFSSVAQKLGFIEAQYYWRELNGRYFRNAIISLNPLVFNSFTGYKIMTLSILTLMFGSFLLFVNSIFSNLYSKKKVFLFSLLLFIFYLHDVPSIGNSVYWMSGSITYQLPNILSLILFSIILKIPHINKLLYKTTLILLSIVLIIFIVGCNEISSTVLLLLLSLFLLFDTINKRKVNWILTLFVLTTIIAIIISFWGNGNFERMSNNNDSQNIWLSINLTLKNGVVNLISWLKNPVIILPTVLFIPFAAFITKNDNNKKLCLLHPISPFFILFSAVIMSHFPFFFATGIDYLFGRCLSVIYLLFLIGWFLCVYNLVRYFKLKRNYIFYKLPVYAIISIKLLIILTLIFSQTSNTLKVCVDLFSGTATNYNAEMNNRYLEVKKCQVDTCFLSKINNYPLVIFGDYIDSNENGWANRHFARFFNKKAVRLIDKPNNKKR